MIAGICVVWVLSALTMPAGIGGGILFVPVMRIVGGLSQSASSGLSQVFITGAAFGSILFQVAWQMRFKSEPLLAQPYFVVMMLPALLSGSLVGVYLSHLLPEVVCLIILVCLCAVSSVLIFKKALATYMKENRIFKARVLFTEEQTVIPSPIRVADRGISLVSIEVGINVHPETGMYLDIEVPPPAIEENASTLSSPSRSVGRCSLSREAMAGEEVGKPVRSWMMKTLTKSISSFVLFIICYWSFFAICTLLRGSRSQPSFSGIVPCGGAYWAVAGVQVITGIVVATLVAFGEYKLISLTFLTGLLATVSGASGGIILNPILLNRGLDPQQTSSTSTIMMLVMASCSALDFLTTGRVEPVLASLMGVTFIGSVIGMTLVTWLVRALGRQSILVFLLGGLVVVGGFLLLYVGIKDVVSDYQVGISPFQFGYLC